MSTDLQPKLDLDGHWSLHPQVSVRPEPFGALLYHFGTRKLSFLKDRRLLDVVQGLATHDTAIASCAAAGITPEELPQIQRSLATLRDSAMIVEQK